MKRRKPLFFSRLLMPGFGFFLLSFPGFAQGLTEEVRQVTNTDCKLYCSACENKSYRWDGPCMEGFLHGNGTIAVMDSSGAVIMTYQGEMKNGKREGKGRVTTPEGYEYEGDFLNNLEHGIGKARYPNNDSYIGDFKYATRDGYGTYTYADGSVYTGNYSWDERHGEGTHITASGDVYRGTFHTDLMEGQGSILFANGDSYEGEFEFGEMQGQGVLVLKKDRLTIKGLFNESEASYAEVFNQKGKKIGEYEDGLFRKYK